MFTDIKHLWTCLICYGKKVWNEMASGGAICTECANRNCDLDD